MLSNEIRKNKYHDMEMRWYKTGQYLIDVMTFQKKILAMYNIFRV